MGRHNYSELYSAIQKDFVPEDMTQDRLEQWLYHGESGTHKVKWGKDDKGKQRYRKVVGGGISSGTRDIAKELSQTKVVYDKAKEEADITELVKLKTEVKTLKVHQSKVEDELLDSIKVAQEVKDKEQARAEEIAAQDLLSGYKEAETVEERKEARRQLKETLPYSLRSAKGWESRYGQRAFRQVFGED
jgi:hypothetical protein